MRYLLVLFVALPLVELFLLLELAERIGGGTTLLLVIGTAVIGAFLIKRQGVATLLRARERIAAGSLPAVEFVEGLLLAVAGAFLVTPGIVTDLAGLAVAIEPLRQRLARWLLESGLARASLVGAGNHRGHRDESAPEDVIDVEVLHETVTRHDDRD